MKMTNGCKIGKIRVKSTGQIINVIPTVKKSVVSQNMIQDVVRCLDGHSNPSAYLFMILDEDGTYTTGMDAEKFPFGYAAFITMVKSLLDRDVLTNAEVKHFCKQQGWLT